MSPRITVIHTPDGDKLRDTKTKKLVGSVPRKPKTPTSSKASRASISESDKDKENKNLDTLVSLQSWFHSTPEILDIGTVLVPGVELDNNNFAGERGASNRKVWIEPKAYLALGWGSQVARSKGLEITHIYEVKPSSIPIKKGNNGWVTESAIVVKLVMTLPAIKYSLQSSKDAVKDKE